MWIPLLHDMITAVLATAIALGAVWVWARTRGRSHVRAWSDRATDETGSLLQERVRRGVEEALADPAFEEKLREMEARVRQGVVEGLAEAGLQEALEGLGDEIEARVRTGVAEGIRSLASPDRLRDTTLNISEAGANLVGESLNALLGGTKKPPPRDDE